ncbi:hypothetical protein [Sphingomonas sp.]
MRHTLFLALLPLSLAACGTSTNEQEKSVLAAENAAGLDGETVELPGGEGEAMADPAAIAAAETTDDWIGEWRGVEGTMLTIVRGETPGRYRLTMQYTLDDRGSFDGLATEQGIAFSRPDGDHVLRASDGDATGLKWLAGKRDCLTVQQGEGYCRD